MSSTGAQKTKRAPFVIPSLDGIRAISFMLVFLAHAGFPYIPGGFGVTVFFFLSGYLITTLLRREAEETGTLSFKLFYLRRVLRILPPFYAVLLLAFVLTRVGLLPHDVLVGGADRRRCCTTPTTGSSATAGTACSRAPACTGRWR